MSIFWNHVSYGHRNSVGWGERIWSGLLVVPNPSCGCHREQEPRSYLTARFPSWLLFKKKRARWKQHFLHLLGSRWLVLQRSRVSQEAPPPLLQRPFHSTPHFAICQAASLLSSFAWSLPHVLSKKSAWAHGEHFPLLAGARQVVSTTGLP